MSVAREHKVYIPDAIDMMSLVDDADVSEVGDSGRGRLQRIYNRDEVSDTLIETYRQRGSRQNGLTLLLPESSIVHIDLDAVTSIQRRSEIGRDWEYAWHYTQIQRDTDGTTNPTANLSLQDGLTLRNVSAVYDRRIYIDRTEPIYRVNDTFPVSAFYDDTPHQEQGGNVFVLWAGAMLEASQDNGFTWTRINTDNITLIGSVGFATSFWGRLFVSLQDFVLFTDNPFDATPTWVQCVLSGNITTFWDVARSGSVLYAVHEFSLPIGHISVAKSIDGGETWVPTGFVPVLGSNGRISAKGRVVVFGIPEDNLLFYSVDSGDNWQQFPQIWEGTLKDVNLGQPNRLNPDDVIVHVTTTAQVWEGRGFIPKDWRVKFDLNLVSSVSRTFLDGWGIFVFGRTLSGEHALYKDIGDNCPIEISQKNDTIDHRIPIISCVADPPSAGYTNFTLEIHVQYDLNLPNTPIDIEVCFNNSEIVQGEYFETDSPPGLVSFLKIRFPDDKCIPDCDTKGGFVFVSFKRRFNFLIGSAFSMSVQEPNRAIIAVNSTQV